MSKFISNSVNQIITTSEANTEIKEKYKGICSENKKLLLKYFIYEINSVIDGEKNIYKLNIDQIYCDKVLISETHDVTKL